MIGRPIYHSGACHKLLIDIVYHGVKDWQDIEDEARYESAPIDERFVDDDHAQICADLGYTSGLEELRAFFASDWFERICLEFESISAADIRHSLGDEKPK